MKINSNGFWLLTAALLFAAVSALFAGSDIDEFRSCKVCGMDRKAFGYSRMLVSYRDGSRSGVCSLHCAVTDIAAHKEPGVASTMVADRDSRALIDAEKAIWVIGGKKRGVMTQRAKWAFAAREAAQSFVDANGGTIIGWDTAQRAALEDAGLTGTGKKK